MKIRKLISTFNIKKLNKNSPTSNKSPRNLLAVITLPQVGVEVYFTTSGRLGNYHELIRQKGNSNVNSQLFLYASNLLVIPCSLAPDAHNCIADVMPMI